MSRRPKQIKLLSKDEETRLVLAWQRDGDLAARDRLLLSFEPLVFRTAIKWCKRAPAYVDDLIQEGNLGLMKALEKFDTSRNHRFSTYAAWWAWSYMGDYLLKYGKAVAGPMTAKGRSQFFKGESTVEVMSLDVPISDSPDSSTFGELMPAPEIDIDGEIDRDAMAARLWAALDVLTPKQRKVVVDRRLRQNGDGATLQTLAEEFGCSREWVRVIEVKGLRLLREAMGVGG